MKNLNGRPNNIHENENAITLVALIITIIILIILAAVTINSLTHDGLADMAIKGAQDYDKAQLDEMNMLNDIDAMVRETVKNIEDGTITSPDPSDPDNPTPPEPSNPWNKDDIKEEVIGDISVPVPDDAEVIEKVDDINKGLVIKDANDNEWVWVPVDEATYNSMFEESETPIALTGNTGVTTTKYSKGEIISGLDRNRPGKSGYREPDIVPDSFYADADSRAQTAGFVNLQDMATKMASEYNKMADSIKKYGGFYIGRYELSVVGVKANQSPTTNINWYNSYKQCKDLTIDETKGMVRMIWRM